MKKTAHFIFALCCFLATTAITSGAFAQGQRGTIQLSGLVVDGDSAYGVPGVHIYIHRAGLGTISNQVGFFNLPVISGDTVVFSAIGYKKQQLIVPQRQDMGLSVLIDLKTDTTLLPVVEVFPFPTEELFKEAFLALQLPDEGRRNIAKNLDPDALTRMAMALPMDGSGNYRHYMGQQINHSSNRYFAPTFSFLNPFAWAQFIKSVKRGDLKKKD